MRQLKRTEYQSVRKSDKLALRLGYAGTIAISPRLSKLIGANAGDRVVITCDDANDYFIGKAKDSNDQDGFQLRFTSKSAGEKYLQFNAAAMVKEMVDAHDLALSKEKKKSILLEVSNEATTWNGIKLYQIELS